MEMGEPKYCVCDTECVVGICEWVLGFCEIPPQSPLGSSQRSPDSLAGFGEGKRKRMREEGGGERDGGEGRGKKGKN